jgi:single-strand DNA-binding protein
LGYKKQKQQRRRVSGMSNPEITIIGRLAADPEYREFGQNTAAKFRVITSDRRKNEDGNWVDINTSGWNIVAWNSLAESCRNVLAKGQEVTVIGSVKEDTWTDKDGNSRKTVETSASSISVSTYAIQKAGRQSVNESTSELQDSPAWG